MLGSLNIRYAPMQFSDRSLARLWPIGIKLILEFSIFIGTIIALAGPHLLSERHSILEEGIDIALVLDVSASMQAADFKPTRLSVLKKISSAFVKRSGTNRIGVYVFAQDTFTQSPLTSDHSVLLELIEGLNFGIIDHSKSGGTAIGDALLTATDVLVKNKIEKREQAIILITDGENSFGVDPALAARQVKEQNIRLYIIGLAGESPIAVMVDGKPYLTPSGETLVTSLNDPDLKKIAEAGDGRYFRAYDENILTDIMYWLSRLEKSPLEVKKYSSVHSYRPLAAILLIPLLLSWLYVDGFLLQRPMR